ncbi:hypothetical protein [Candidatus Ichthyocystis sparus]|uniref:hypothetical protein n=1 Tax=Candidatus Ichthyocystis sparus TaxID=1561004 RepID=UPI000B80EEC5|nr:hypothetical protein [Candidatus Ichthyocystis sparus]
MNINNRNCTTNSSGNDGDNDATDGSDRSQGPLSQKASKRRGGGSSSGGLNACRLSVFSVLSCLMVLLQEVSSSTTVSSAANGTSDSSNSTASPMTTSSATSTDMDLVGTCIVTVGALLMITALALVFFCFLKERMDREEERMRFIAMNQVGEVEETTGNGVVEGEETPLGYFLPEGVLEPDPSRGGRVLGTGTPPNLEDLLEPDPSRGGRLGAGVPEEEPDVGRCGRVLSGGVLEPAIVILTHTGNDDGAEGTDSD